MSWVRSDAIEIAARFIGDTAQIESHALGSGIDGIVFLTSTQSAVKIFRAQRLYEQELAAYRRLTQNRVETVCGHAVPRFIRSDEDLLAIEMSTVEPPYVIDFAKCRFDVRPDYPEDAITEWHAQLEEWFGDRWTDALRIHNELFRRYGIYYDDMKPGNIMFAV